MNPLLIRRRGMIQSFQPPIFHARVRFDGVATIQTDILLPEDGSIRMSTGGETLKQVQGIFAFRNTAEDATVTGMWLNSSTNSTRRVYAGRYDSKTTESSHPQVNNYTTRVTVCITPNFLQVGSNSSVYHITKGTFPPDSGLWIGSEATGVRYTGAIGYIYLYDNTAATATSISDLTNNYTPIITLIPCEYNDEVGYWDINNNVFYGNTAGAGTLTVED